MSSSSRSSPTSSHVSLSHEVLPRAPEFERTSTTLVNAYVAPKITAYVERLVEQPAPGRASAARSC